MSGAMKVVGTSRHDDAQLARHAFIALWPDLISDIRPVPALNHAVSSALALLPRPYQSIRTNWHCRLLLSGLHREPLLQAGTSALPVGKFITGSLRAAIRSFGTNPGSRDASSFVAFSLAAGARVAGLARRSARRLGRRGGNGRLLRC